MAESEDRARAAEAPPGLLVHAARAAFKAATTPATADGDANAPAWALQLLAPFRPMLGDLALALPGILQRVGSSAGGAGTRVLLYRTRHPMPKREAPLWDDSREPHIEVSAALRNRLSAALQGLDLALALEQMAALTQDPRRLQLPALLEDLKQAVRADRAAGLRRVRDELKWLLGERKSPEPAYELLDRLSDVLGESNLKALRRRNALGALLTGPSVDGGSFPDSLRAAFGSIGCPLPDAHSVMHTGNAKTLTLHVGDHERDRLYEVTYRPSRTAKEVDVEVHGAAPGADYRDLRLPLRVHDAANGFATWMVDRRDVHDAPECFTHDGGLRMRTFDVGAQRTPLALFFVHHRDTDAGAYFELGLGCFVAPPRDPLAVGMMALGRILVSTERGARLGRDIWGWEKEHVPEDQWKVSYRPAALHCRVAVPGAEIYLALPRGGSACTTAMPALLYTRKPALGPWHRSAMLRSGRGEQLRVAGGGVRLQISIKQRQAALSHPLLRELFRFGLINAEGTLQREPSFAAWSEHVEAEIGPPLPLPLPEPVFD